ncbi:MAG: aldehyde dehydrogenase family protein [Dietzia sp.]
MSDSSLRLNVAGDENWAVDRGAVVSHRGAAPDGSGFFYPPTVLAGLDEGIFGPVGPLVVWRDLDELLAAATRRSPDLAAYVYAELAEALPIGAALEAGMVGRRERRCDRGGSLPS